MGMRHAVLGVAQDGPATRYELLVRLRWAFPLYRFSSGGVYDAIKSLADAGLLSPREVKDDADIAVFEITAPGSGHLRNWVRKPSRPGVVRDDLRAQIAYSEVEDLPALAERVQQRLEWVARLMDELRDPGEDVEELRRLDKPWRTVRLLIVRVVALSVLDGMARGLRQAHAEILRAQTELSG